MSDGGIKMGMTPPHPGTFIRIEALEELGLSVAAAARILGVRRGGAAGGAYCRFAPKVPAMPDCSKTPAASAWPGP